MPSGAPNKSLELTPKGPTGTAARVSYRLGAREVAAAQLNSMLSCPKIIRVGADESGPSTGANVKRAKSRGLSTSREGHSALNVPSLWRGAALSWPERSQYLPPEDGSSGRCPRAVSANGK